MSLSPGDFYQSVPKDMAENVAFRHFLLHETTVRQKKALLEICAQDVLFWIDSFGLQYNPDAKDSEMKLGPFICRVDQEAILVGGDAEIAAGVRRYQHGLLYYVEERKTVRMPKVRYVGATWLICFMSVWLCLFHKQIKILIMSKDEKTALAIDDEDSIFWKIAFIVDHLPAWMKPTIRKKRGVIKIGKNTITSSANVESAGVGGRATVMILDEFGQFKKGHEIFSMTDDTASCRIIIGTHKGRDTMFYALCKEEPYASTIGEIVVHWSHDPEKRKGLYRVTDHGLGFEVLDKSYQFPFDFKFVTEAKPAGGPFPLMRSPWYDAKALGRTPYSVAMNLDIDPDGSNTTFFDGFTIGILKSYCREPVFKGNVEYDKDSKTVIRLVPHPDGCLKIWTQMVGELEFPRMRGGAGADIGSGSGLTPSCLSAWNVGTGEKVFSYSDARIYVPDFAMLCVALLKMIRDKDNQHPLLGWEAQYGGAFARKIMEECGYTRIYRRVPNELIVRTGQARDVSNPPGLNMSPSVKLMLLEQYKDALFAKRIVNFEEHALDETLFFVYAGKSVEYRRVNAGRVKKADSKATVHHGDIVMADAIGYKMICEQGFESAIFSTYEKSTIPDPRTSGFREWLAEREQEEELVWL